VSPVFRHGRLRLYLLKLLDESPRHGYEVIRLLQDRFMGVYAPSPGTIYPRLARLEEDGLVTHEEVDGKKVYSITDKGREEIRNRLGDLADLEDELTESLRDVAREISEDVRDTVRSIREELTSAAREFRNSQEGKAGRDKGGPDKGGPDKGGPGKGGEPDAGSPRRPGESDEAHRIRQEARRSREQMRATFRAQGPSHGDWAAWQERMSKTDGGWGSWADWFGGREDWFGTGKAGAGSTSDAGQDDTTESGGESGPGKRSRRGGQNPFSDLERMAMQFATELRSAARQTGSFGERSLSDLRDILTDTLAKVRVEVFSDNEPAADKAETEDSGRGPTDSAPADSAPADSAPTDSAPTEPDAT
jgi:DNA-binding PadR family transcriptional regulator